MPFIKRKISPSKIRCHQDNGNHVFEEHIDVVNNAMVGALLQLSSLTFHAEEIFREIEEELSAVCTKCDRVRGKLEQLDERTRKLNHRDVPIPMSDLNAEGKIPLHFHYKSSDALQDNFFTVDSRSPCLIHLHTLADDETYDVFQNSQPHITGPFQKSFVNDSVTRKSSPTSDGLVTNRSTSSNHPSELEQITSHSSLPTPDERMKQQSAQHKAEIVTVDTSGAQFERRVVLRRSQRSSVSAVRRKSQLKYRSRLHTASSIPPRLGNNQARSLNGIPRSNSALSDGNSNSSFLGDISVCNSEPCQNKQGVEIQADQVRLQPLLKLPRNIKHRYSMPLPTRGSNKPQRLAHVSLASPNSNNSNHLETSAKENEVREKTVDVVTAKKSSPDEDTSTNNNEQILTNERLYSSQTDDRISSGFWSGSESCRHSTTSEILMQHHHVTQALQQILAKHPPPASKSGHADTDSSNVSTLSINSHLSTFRQSPNSSFLSLDIPSLEDHNISAADNVFSPANGSHYVSPRHIDSIPSGGYSYVNPGYMEVAPHFSYLPLPMTVIAPGTSPSRKDSKKSPSPKANAVDKLPNASSNSPFSSISNDSEKPPVDRLTSTPENIQFFGPNFQPNSDNVKHKQAETIRSYSCELHYELKNNLQKRQESLRKKKPPLPRRTSSLKSPRNFDKILVEVQPKVVGQSLPIKNLTKSIRNQMENHYQTPRSPPARKLDYVPISSDVSDRNAKFKHTSKSSISDVAADLSRKNAAHETSPQNVQSTPEEKSSTSVAANNHSVTAKALLSNKVTSNENSFTETKPLHSWCNGVSSPKSQSNKDSTSIRKMPIFDSSEAKICRNVSDCPATPKTQPSASTPKLSTATTKVDILISESPPVSNVPVHNVEPLKTNNNSDLKREYPSTSVSDVTSSPMMSSIQSSNVITAAVMSLATCTTNSTQTSANTASVSLPIGPMLNQKPSGPITAGTDKLNLVTTISVSKSISSKESSQTMTSTADSLLKVTSSSTTSSPSAKAVVRPIPFPHPTSRFRKSERSEFKQEDIKRRNANARAAFFGLSAPTVTDLKVKNEVKQQNQESKDGITKDVEKVEVLQNQKFTENHLDKTYVAKKSISPILDKKSQKTEDLSLFQETDIDEIGPDPAVNYSSINQPAKMEPTVTATDTSNSSRPESNSVNMDPQTILEINFHQKICVKNEKNQVFAEDKLLNCDDSSNHANSSTEIVPLKKSICANGSVTSEKPKVDTSNVNSSTSHFTQPPTSPQLSNGITSPASSQCSSPTLNGNSCSPNLERTQVRPASSASRADFKAMLLQNFSRSSTGSNISATEKLQRTRVSAIQDLHNGEGARQRIVSAGDIRAVLGTSRSNRRTNLTDYRRSIADSSIYSNMKHQSLFLSGRRYSNRNRPTRPMLSISEDGEGDELSGDKTNEKQRSASVTAL